MNYSDMKNVEDIGIARGLTPEQLSAFTQRHLLKILDNQERIAKGMEAIERRVNILGTKLGVDFSAILNRERRSAQVLSTIMTDPNTLEEEEVPGTTEGTLVSVGRGLRRRFDNDSARERGHIVKALFRMHFLNGIDIVDYRKVEVVDSALYQRILAWRRTLRTKESRKRAWVNLLRSVWGNYKEAYYLPAGYKEFDYSRVVEPRMNGIRRTGK